MTSELKRKVKKRKQKEDLDGSRLFREHGDDDPNEESMISQNQPSHHQVSSNPAQSHSKPTSHANEQNLIKGVTGGPATAGVK